MKLKCLLVLGIILVPLFVTAADLPIHSIRTYFQDGSRIEVNSIFNSQCEVTTCRQDEYYNGIWFRFDKPGGTGDFYEIYLFADGTVSYRHMFPRSPIGEVSKDGVHWERYDFSK